MFRLPTVGVMVQDQAGEHPGNGGCGTGPAGEVSAIVDAWAVDGALAPSTVQRMSEIADRFASRLAAMGVGSLLAAEPGHCETFIWAATRRGRPPSLHTVHLRRTTLRALYRSLRPDGAEIGDPTLHIDLPPKTERAVRALTDDELVLLRTTALGRHRQPTLAAAVVALAEASATTGEIPQVRWCDVDLERGTVALPGAPPVRPRIGTLTTWGCGVLHRHRDQSTPGRAAPVCHGAISVPASHAAQAATTNRLRRLLVAAGLADPDLRPTSVRLWAADRAHRLGQPIEAVARILGLASLDATADAIDYEWKELP